MHNTNSRGENTVWGTFVVRGRRSDAGWRVAMRPRIAVAPTGGMMAKRELLSIGFPSGDWRANQIPVCAITAADAMLATPPDLKLATELTSCPDSD